MRYRNPKNGQWAKLIPIGSTVIAEWEGHTTNSGEVVGHIILPGQVMPYMVKAHWLYPDGTHAGSFTLYIAFDKCKLA